MDKVVRAFSQIQWSYGDKDAAALAILEGRIIEKARNLALITYSDLVKGVVFHLPNINNGAAYTIQTYDWSGLDRKIIGDFLGYASYRSYRQHGFMMSALVVNKDEFRPSWHFFDFMQYLEHLEDSSEDSINRYWIEQINKAHQFYGGRRRRAVVQRANG